RMLERLVAADQRACRHQRIGGRIVREVEQLSRELAGAIADAGEPTELEPRDPRRSPGDAAGQLTTEPRTAHPIGSDDGDPLRHTTRKRAAHSPCEIVEQSLAPDERRRVPSGRGRGTWLARRPGEHDMAGGDVSEPTRARCERAEHLSRTVAARADRQIAELDATPDGESCGDQVFARATRALERTRAVERREYGDPAAALAADELAAPPGHRSSELRDIPAGRVEPQHCAGDLGA